MSRILNDSSYNSQLPTKEKKTMHEEDPKHHADAIEKNIETHPGKLAIGVGIGAVALVIGIILLVQLAVGTLHQAPKEAMSNEAVARRLAPVGKLAVDPNAKAPEPAKTVPVAMAAATPAVAIPPPAAGKAGAADGKKVYDSTCTACHGTGVAGAPKLGDKAAWAPRLKAGVNALHESAIKGKGAMPPKGGGAALSDAEVKAAVDYMVAAGK